MTDNPAEIIAQAMSEYWRAKDVIQAPVAYALEAHAIIAALEEAGWKIVGCTAQEAFEELRDWRKWQEKPSGV